MLSILLISQAATVVTLMPVAVAMGLPASVLVGVYPAVNGSFFLPTYGTVLAAVSFDQTGSTRIGKYLLNHSFMWPGLVTSLPLRCLRWHRQPPAVEEFCSWRRKSPNVWYCSITLKGTFYEIHAFSRILLWLCVLLVRASPGARQNTSTEKDLLGEKQIPADEYYGVQTARALENFQLSGVLINHYPGFVEAWAIVKLAAARANTDVGAMKKEKLAMIEKACQAVLDGKYHDQFVVDWYQGGAGTSTNMNANEVLANIALEMSGHKKGEYEIVDPHDDLNMSQSTNDSYPTAIKVAFILRNDKLVEELREARGLLP